MELVRYGYSADEMDRSIPLAQRKKTGGVGTVPRESQRCWRLCCTGEGGGDYLNGCSIEA